MSENKNEGFDNINDEQNDNGPLVLTDDRGNEIEFEWLDTVELDDNKYVILLPLEDEDCEEVVILKVEENEEEDDFISVEDEEELNKVYDIFKDRNQENFDFID